MVQKRAYHSQQHGLIIAKNFCHFGGQLKLVTVYNQESTIRIIYTSATTISPYNYNSLFYTVCNY